MMRSVYLKTLYQKRWMTLFWTLGVVAMVSFTLAFFPTLKNSGLGETFSQLPPQFAKLAGDSLSFSSIQGYIGEQLFGLRMPMMTIILAIVLFTGITATDEDRGTLASQLTLPISRSRLLLEKFLAATTILTIIHIAVGLGIVATLAGIHESVSLFRLIETIFGCWLLSLCWGSLTFLLGASTGLKSITIGITSYFIFQAYLVTSLVSSIDKLKPIEKASLFHYYQGGDIMRNGLHDWNLFLLVLVTVVFTTIGLQVFQRRDVRN